MDWQARFEAGLAYEPFLEQHAEDKDRANWQTVYEKLRLTDRQAALVGGFKRQMNVLALVGAWCGDCVTQGPIFQRIAEASPTIDLRYIDRDVHDDLQRELSICGGNRVPVVVFLSEDFHECARVGDRTLSRYRHMAAQQLGGACPLPLATPADVIVAMLADWVDEFERVQLMLLLSGRLRQMHGD